MKDLNIHRKIYNVSNMGCCLFIPNFVLHGYV